MQFVHLAASEGRAAGTNTMENTNQSTYYLGKIREAMRSGDIDTPLGQAVMRLKQPFVLGDGQQWHYEGFISLFSAVRQTLAALDDTITPGLPSFYFDPGTIAHLFALPLEKFNWRGVPPHGDVGPTASSSRSGSLHGCLSQPGLLRLRQCVALSGHSESTLRRAIRDGRLKAHTIGRGRKRPTYGILGSDLQAYLEATRLQFPDLPSVPTTKVTKKSRHFD